MRGFCTGPVELVWLPPDTQYAKDLVESLNRGDVDGASIIFTLPAERSRVVWIEEGEVEIREIHACKLYEAGPVSIPAYDATTAGVRSADRERIEAEAREALARRGALSEVQVRLARLKAGGFVD